MAWTFKALSAAALLAAAGCSSTDGLLAGGVQDESPADPRDSAEARARRGSLSEVFGGAQVGNARIGDPAEDALVGAVNRHLWRASLETLSFLPIASTDPFTGVIATDWAIVPDAPDERYKVTAYVTDTVLTPQALRVAVFRERRGAGGWTAAPVAAETPRQLEDSILVRARQLRIAELEGPGAG